MFTLPEHIKIKSVMSSNYLEISVNCSINKLIHKLLENNLDDGYIINQGKLLSVVTLVDIASFIQDNINLNRRIGEFIDKECVVISPENNIVEARNLMSSHSIGRLPVVQNNKLLGVIRKDDIIEHFYKKIEAIDRNMNIIIDSIHEAICVIDEEGIVKLWNKNAEKLYKISKNEILGHNVNEMFPNALIMSPLKTGEKYDNLYHIPKKGNHVAISVQPIYDNGEIVGVVSSERDITEVKELSKQLKQATETVKFLEDEVRSIRSEEFNEILGRSKKIKSCIERAKQVAKTKASILINGESGTGKELFANAIHNYSDRKKLFIPVNCSAIPSELFESEFFGYKEGAFTGAKKKGKKGYFELANNGTIFLDEIGEMPLGLQAKLLRVLQEHRIKPVGSEEYIDIDIRVIAATNKDLTKLIKEGKFREDLYFRLNVISIDLPPLNQRISDIELLIHYFIDDSCETNGRCIEEISKEAIECLIQYDWPGNVRELKNVVEQMVVLSQNSKIDLDSIPEYIKKKNRRSVNMIDTLDLEILTKNIEKQAILTAIQRANGSKTKAAKLLNIPRTTLYYKLDKYDISSKN